MNGGSETKVLYCQILLASSLLKKKKKRGGGGNQSTANNDKVPAEELPAARPDSATGCLS